MNALTADDYEAAAYACRQSAHEAIRRMKDLGEFCPLDYRKTLLERSHTQFERALRFELAARAARTGEPS